VGDLSAELAPPEEASILFDDDPAWVWARTEAGAKQQEEDGRVIQSD
jgi:hypothetical protein